MKKLIILLSLLFLIGCETTPDSRKYVQPIVLHPPKPDAADIRDISWQIWNLEKMKVVVAEADADVDLACLNLTSPVDLSFSWWVLDAQQYQNFILDVAEVKRYIEQQNLIIQYYRDQFPSNETEQK